MTVRVCVSVHECLPARGHAQAGRNARGRPGAPGCPCVPTRTPGGGPRLGPVRSPSRGKRRQQHATGICYSLPAHTHPPGRAGPKKQSQPPRPWPRQLPRPRSEAAPCPARGWEERAMPGAGEAASRRGRAGELCVRTVHLAREASSPRNEAQKQSFPFSAQANALPVASGDKPGRPSPSAAPRGTAATVPGARGEAATAR